MDSSGICLFHDLLNIVSTSGNYSDILLIGNYQRDAVGIRFSWICMVSLVSSEEFVPSPQARRCAD